MHTTRYDYGNPRYLGNDPSHFRPLSDDEGNSYDEGNPTYLEKDPSHFRPYGLGTWGIGANWVALPGTFENCRDNGSYAMGASPSVCKEKLTPGALVLARIIGIIHLAFDILGYIPGIQSISGLVRIGFAAVVLTPAFCLLNSVGGLTPEYIPHLKALVIGQLARGALEIIPFGFIANAILDMVATPVNLLQLHFYGSIITTTSSDYTSVPSWKYEAHPSRYQQRASSYY